MIIAISGASGVGKTTALKTLAEKLADNPKIKVLHFDDMGMPNWDEVEDPQKWQEDATVAWVDKLVKTAREENVHVLFEGSTDFRFYVQGFEQNGFSDYQLFLFDCSEETMKTRLIQRGQAELYQPDMVGWLNYLRREAIAQEIEIIKTDQLSIVEIGQHIIRALP
ncbi:MAG: AAA family ATPase [Bacteroidota bacterium]